MESTESKIDPSLREQELELERYKARLDFRKTIIIGGYVAVAIALIPPLFQLASAAVEYVKFEHQLRLDDQSKKSDRENEAQKFRSQYVSAFLDKALNQDIELRLRLAEYFKYVAQGDDFKNRWASYYDALQDKRNDIRHKIEVMEAQLAQKQKAPPSQRDYTEEEKIVQRLSWLRGEMGYVAPDRSVVRDPRNASGSAAANVTISLDELDLGKREIAQKILSGFKKAGFGANQQATALASAIKESNLNPSFTSADGIGLFSLNRRGGFGTGYTEAQLMDPDTNIQIVVDHAKAVLPFVNAANLDDSVQTFVRLIMRPAQPDSYALSIGEIARRLIRTI